MIKYLTILLLIDHQMKCAKEIEVFRKSCNENGHTYQIGENYSKHDDHCRLCTCTPNERDECVDILNCQDLDCKIQYHITCCIKFECRGILFIIRKMGRIIKL